MCLELPYDCDGMWAKIMCSNPDVFIKSLTTFLLGYGIELETPMRHSDEPWDILRHFFLQLEEKYPTFKKYFLLDDAAADCKLFDVIDDVARRITTLDSEARSLWKLIVTARDHTIKPSHYCSIGKNNFVKFSEFSVKDAQSVCNLEVEDGDDQREFVQQLYDELGSLPLALREALIDYDSKSEVRICDRTKFFCYSINFKNSYSNRF